MSNNTPDYEDNLYFDTQNTKNEQQKDLRITVEKQVWESTLNRSMVLQAENEQLKELLKEIRQQITEQVFGSPKIQLFEGTFDDKLLAKIDEVLK